MNDKRYSIDENNLATRVILKHFEDEERTPRHNVFLIFLHNFRIWRFLIYPSPSSNILAYFLVFSRINVLLIGELWKDFLADWWRRIKEEGFPVFQDKSIYKGHSPTENINTTTFCSFDWPTDAPSS
ncbi:unnamed protein product [Citrullus colocynthis]|uniref:Uncharacterized protein n=1 Tax=Citrullus colocynthis TaxID=252529 RepID=A0ABP0Z901_9ROSI